MDRGISSFNVPFGKAYGKYNTEPYDKLQMDLMYVNQMGLVSDK